MLQQEEICFGASELQVWHQQICQICQQRALRTCSRAISKTIEQAAVGHEGLPQLLLACVLLLQRAHLPAAQAQQLSVHVNQIVYICRPGQPPFQEDGDA